MLKSALPVALVIGAISMPWADDRSEEELARQFEERVVQSFHAELAQAEKPETNLERQIRKNQEDYRQEVYTYSYEKAPQYIWSPDGKLQGWQQPDARGNIQQYDLKGDWKGTIYNED